MNPALPNSLPLHEVVITLARLHRLGSVGVAGRHAMGIASASDPLDVLVCVPLERADAFGLELAEAAQCAVHLHRVERLPWSSHLHLCVRWYNVDRLPRVPYPRGAVSHVQIDGTRYRVPLASIPHMQAVDGPPPPPKTGRATEVFRAPIGGFLI